MKRLTVLLLCGLALLLLLGLSAGPAVAGVSEWRPLFDSVTPYEELQPILDDLVASSDRVKYEVMGTSAGGHDLYLVDRCQARGARRPRRPPRLPAPHA